MEPFHVKDSTGKMGQLLAASTSGFSLLCNETLRGCSPPRKPSSDKRNRSREDDKLDYCNHSKRAKPTSPHMRRQTASNSVGSASGLQTLSNSERLRLAKETISSRGLTRSRRASIVVPEHQQPTSNTSFIDKLLPPNKPSVMGTISGSSVTKTVQPQYQNPLGYHPVHLASRIYTPLAILRSHIKGGEHLGVPCHPVTETLVLLRDSNQIEKWKRITTPPAYFNRVEADANIKSYSSSVYSFRRRAADMGLHRSIQDIIRDFDILNSKCKSCLLKASRSSVVPRDWWPVGVKEADDKPNTSIESTLLCNYSPKITVIDLRVMIYDVFKLPSEAAKSVLSKNTSLLHEVSKLCKMWEKERKTVRLPKHVPPQYGPFTVIIGPNERILEMKEGVYYLLDRGTVVKFLTKASHLPQFIMESLVGYNAQDKIKGVVGVSGVCPQGFCIEMEFAGVSLRDVITGDVNCILNKPLIKDKNSHELMQHHIGPSTMKSTLYGVRMLQSTGRLPEKLKHKCKIPISDSYSAVGVANIMRMMLLDQLPFVITEIVNIVTRLSQQGLVNIDIKSDNIVIDGLSGQPKMIDLGLVVPAGTSDELRTVSNCRKDIFIEYPQTAPEFLRGEKCYEAAMTYGLAYMTNDILAILVTRTLDMGAASMSLNLPLRNFMCKAYSQDQKERPRAYLMAPLIGACFPLQDNIAKLFQEPKHTIEA
uniref:Wsv423-like protein n=1 Tax=Trachysalambria curvirostris nimavirus TaxID=2984282 RepID=A0A9C7C046_9VIRU|nr:MAG: wsv423-like protein [Trachysalambria curvirostris nimavirus]